MRVVFTFHDPLASTFENRFLQIVSYWYYFSAFMFFVIGVSLGEWQNIATSIFLFFWYLILIQLYEREKTRVMHQHKQRRRAWQHILSVTILAIIEESIVYAFGGGLAGKATSLTEDLLKAVPVFVGILIGILVTHKYKPLRDAQFFLIASLMGFTLEVILNGVLLYAWLLGGPGMGIYAAMIIYNTPHEENLEGQRPVISIIMGYILSFIFAVIGAIIGDTIYNSL